MYSSAESVDEYIASLPEGRKKTVAELRKFLKKHIPKGYEEGMDFGMIVYYIPLSMYPDTYNHHPLGYVALASQKNYFSLYMMGLYGRSDAEKKLRAEFANAGKKLDMGKSCVRFKKLDDLPLEVIAKHIAEVSPKEYVAHYEKSRKK